MHHSESKPCGGNGKRPWLQGRSIDPLVLPGNERVADLIDNVYARSGFNGRRLAEGAQLFSHMIEEGATVCLTVAGAMTPIGMSGIFTTLIERGYVDWIISTGANVYHDLHRAFEFPVVQGSHAVDDNALAEDGVVRIHDVFISDQGTLLATDEVFLRLMENFQPAEPFSTASLHKYLGEAVLKSAPKADASFVGTAAKFDVPIYTPSPGDSSLAMNLIIPHLYRSALPLNPLLDVIETAAIVREAERNGVVEIGGGAPKNFFLQTQPTLQQILRDASKGGHDYFLQLTGDAPHWGGLSGATPSEAKTWGKVKDAVNNNVVVYSCASITFPLIAQYVLERNRPRSPRGLGSRLPSLVESLRSSAASNPAFREYYKGLYGDSPSDQ